MGCTPLLGPGHSRVRSAGPHVGRAVRSVRGRRGCAAVRSLRRRLPLALPLSRRVQARVSAMAGEAGWGGGPRGYGKDPSTPPGRARAARSLFSVRSTVLRCRSCSGDPAPTPAPALAPAPGEGAPAPSSARQAPGPAKVSAAVGKEGHVGLGGGGAHLEGRLPRQLRGFALYPQPCGPYLYAVFLFKSTFFWLMYLKRKPA